MIICLISWANWVCSLLVNSLGLVLWLDFVRLALIVVLILLIAYCLVGFFTTYKAKNSFIKLRDQRDKLREELEGLLGDSFLEEIELALDDCEDLRVRSQIK